MAEVKEGRVRSVTLGEMPASFEQLLEELRHTHHMELAEVKAEADRLLVEKKTWTAMSERSRALEVEDSGESDTTLPDPNLFSSEKVVPLETFLEGEEYPPSPSEGEEADIVDSMAVSAPFENKIDIQEEIENAKPWMDEEGNKHYKNDSRLKGESLQDAGLSLDSPDPLPRDASLLAHALDKKIPDNHRDILKKVRGLIVHAGGDYCLAEWMRIQMEILFNAFAVLEMLKDCKASGLHPEQRVSEAESKERSDRLLAMTKKLTATMAQSMKVFVDAKNKHEDKLRALALDPVKYDTHKAAAAVLEDEVLVKVLDGQKTFCIYALDGPAQDLIRLSKGLHLHDSDSSWKSTLAADANVEEVIAVGDKTFSENLDSNQIEVRYKELLEALQEGKAFVQKVGDLVDVSELKDFLTRGDVLYAQVRAMYSEGLIINSLQTTMDPDSVRCIKLELSLLASGKIKESLMHKSLVAAARQLMKDS